MKSMKDVFLGKGFGFASYARANDLNRVMLHQVLSGKYNLHGKRKKGQTQIGKIWEALRRDGVV
jgi:hypothetical protein